MTPTTQNTGRTSSRAWPVRRGFLPVDPAGAYSEPGADLVALHTATGAAAALNAPKLPVNSPRRCGVGGFQQGDAMTELQTRIMRELAQANALTCGEICRAIGTTHDATQTALHGLDEAGQVFMRNGFYRASAAALAQREAMPGEVPHD